MAERTIKEIYNEMVTAKEAYTTLDGLTPNPDTAQTFLDDLTSASKVAIWRLVFWLMAVSIWTHEKLFLQNIADVEAKAKALKPGVVQWYADEMKKFQNGYSLAWNSDDLVFEYSDTTSAAALAAQIISVASARDISQIVTIKVAKTVAGVTQKLTSAEKAAANTYLEKIKIAGTKTLLISDDPDNLKLALTVEYDPQILASTGILISDGTTKPVQVAIDDYISVDSDGDQGLEFDATFRVQGLVDSVQKALGVVSVTVDVCEGSYGAVPYTLILDVNTESYVPNAGYLQTVDETGSETVPVAGDINDITLDANYQGTYSASSTYTSGDFVYHENVPYKCNTTIGSPEAFTAAKWDTVSAIRFVSI